MEAKQNTFATINPINLAPVKEGKSDLNNDELEVSSSDRNILNTGIWQIGGTVVFILSFVGFLNPFVRQISNFTMRFMRVMKSSIYEKLFRRSNSLEMKQEIPNNKKEMKNKGNNVPSLKILSLKNQSQLKDLVDNGVLELEQMNRKNYIQKSRSSHNPLNIDKRNILSKENGDKIQRHVFVLRKKQKKRAANLPF